MWGRTLSASLIVVIAVGCTPKPSPSDTAPSPTLVFPTKTSTTTLPLNPVTATWREQVRKVADEALSAVNLMDDGLAAHDMATIAKGCEAFRNAVERLAGTLPGPKPELTAVVQSAVDEVREAGRQCQSWQSWTTASDQRSDFGTHVTSAADKVAALTPRP